MIKPLNLENTVIIDTETTGTDKTDEIVQIAIIDGHTGKVLLNVKIKPNTAISEAASTIHGITNKSVRHCPSYSSIHEKVIKLTQDKTVLIYNAQFDHRIVMQTAQIHDCDSKVLEQWHTFCVMKWYAEYYGAWNERFENYRWQQLTAAAAQQNLDISDLSAHDAWSDCEITRRLINAVNLAIEEKSIAC
jgi:DNA polymerase-3 subunit epsilon